MFGSRTRLERSLDAVAAEIRVVRSSADRAATNVEQFVAEQIAERAEAASRRRRVAMFGLLLAVISGGASVYLLASSLPSSPVAPDPGRIGIVLPDGVSESSVEVDASFDASVPDAAKFRLVVSAIPTRESTEFSTSVGFLFCGAIRTGLQLTEANSHEQPTPQSVRSSGIEMDSRLGYRSECDYVTVTTSTWQVILSGSSEQTLATTGGEKVLYVLPGVTTTVIDEEINNSVVHPLPREAIVRVSMENVPPDLIVSASAPQIPANGRLSWATEMAEGLSPPSEYRIAGSLGNRENTTQAALFTAGVLAGIAGSAMLWALEAFVERRPKTG